MYDSSFKTIILTILNLYWKPDQTHAYFPGGRQNCGHEILWLFQLNLLKLSDAYMSQWNYHLGSDNGLSPGRRQAIIWTNAGKLLIGLLGIKFNEILIEFKTFSFKKIHLKMSSAKWRLFRLGLNVLKWVFLGSFIQRRYTCYQGYDCMCQ